MKTKYSWAGVNIPKDLYEGKMSAEEILTHENATTRRVGILLMGGSKLFNGLKDKKLIQHYNDVPADTREGEIVRREYGELWESNIDGESWRFLKVRCPSAGVYDVIISCGAKSILNALAMSAGLSDEEYLAIDEES